MDLIVNNRVQLFRKGWNVKIDQNLPKYKSLVIRDKNIEEIGEESSKIKKQIGEDGSKFVKEFIGNYDSDRFNIKISDYLFEALRISAEKFFGNEIQFSDRYILEGESEINNVTLEEDFYNRLDNSRTFFGRVKNMFRYIFCDRNVSKRRRLAEKQKQKEKTINVLQLFENIKIQVSKEKEFVDRVDQYVTLIKKAQILHQTAQEERLIDDLIIHVYESILAISGFNKYITEDDLVKLQNKCEKKLEIDYLENFIRVVPDEVVEKKMLADSLKIFDNYCVIYYDPDKKSYQQTKKEEKEEIERIKKDPILFGLINGSKKFYYIADWIDELCDLTLDQVVEKIGEIKTID